MNGRIVRGEVKTESVQSAIVAVSELSEAMADDLLDLVHRRRPVPGVLDVGIAAALIRHGSLEDLERAQPRARHSAGVAVAVDPRHLRRGSHRRAQARQEAPPDQVVDLVAIVEPD